MFSCFLLITLIIHLISTELALNWWMPKYMPIDVAMDMVKNKEGSVSLNYPMLGRNNYSIWAIKMKVFMQAQGVWDAVEPKDPKVAFDVRKDKMAMAAIYQAVPEEILLSLAEKQSAKEAWDALKTMFMGVDLVKTWKLQAFKSELEELNMEAEHMKETEQIDDFSIKLNNIDEMTPHVLPGLTPKYLQPEKPLGTFLTGAVNDRASSSRAANEFWLWQGYEVKSEFIGILDCIAKKYPETFDNISVNSKKLYTMKLNMLCNIVKAFTETPMSEFNYNMIAEYRDLFANLQRSFNVKWLVDHLNYIEKLQFSHPLIYKLQAVDSRIEYAISKLQDLQALRVRMTKEIHRNVAVGYIGDLSIF